MMEIDTLVMHSNDPHLSLERRLYLLKQIVAMQTQLNQSRRILKIAGIGSNQYVQLNSLRISPI